MSTLREVAGLKIHPWLQILYGIFNLLLVGALVYSFAGFPKSLVSKSNGGILQLCDGDSNSSSCACPPAGQPEIVVKKETYFKQWFAEGKGLHYEDKFSRCSMDVCFNFSRCDNMDQLLVYHYDTFSPPKWFFKALKKSPYYTEDPQKACIFFVTVDRELDKPLGPPLNTLPYWNHGMNHVVVSFVDNWSNWRNPSQSSLENASTMTSITHQTTYRAGFDISVPLPQLTSFPDLRNLKALDRKYFLTFKGTRYLLDYGGGGFRSNPAMRAMHNGNDVIIATTCRQETNIKLMKQYPELGVGCEEDEVIYRKYDFSDLMNSTFGLAPAGRGPTSFRLLEVLSAGSIPVLISDNFVLPFHKLIQWERCLFLFPTTQMHKIIPTLRALNNHEIEFRRKYCLFIYREFFEDDDKIVRTVILALKSRFYGVLPRLAEKIPLPPKALLASQQR